MYNDYDSERRSYSYEPPQEAGLAREAQRPVNPIGSTPPAGAPAERTDAPVIVSTPRVPQIISGGTYREQVAPAYVPPSQGWQEPMYSTAYETTSNMYTPGIYVAQPAPRKRAADTAARHKNRKHDSHLGRFVRAVCLILICAVLSGASAYGVMEYRLQKIDFAPVNQVVLGGTGASNSQVSSLTPTVATTGPGMSAEDIYDISCTQVVGVITEMPTSASSFGGLNPGSSTAVSGSGFIISSDGYILTNYHVIETAYLGDLPLIVCMNDGTEFAATVIGYEALSDVALIKIDATGLNAAVIADSDNIRVGQRVYAVGNPFGDLAYTMTDGIISALDRVVTVDSGSSKKNINTFQFSAAVNPGNSGGPVYDANGEIIGIVSVKIMGSSVEGIGFAIPINDAIEFASQLIEHGYITGRAFMGITAETVYRAHADYYGFVEGAYVRSVTEGSAADKAGIQFGDIITSLGDDEISSQESLVYTLRKFRAGDTTTLTVWRGGETIELEITFDENMTAGQPQRQLP